MPAWRRRAAMPTGATPTAMVSATAGHRFRGPAPRGRLPGRWTWLYRAHPRARGGPGRAQGRDRGGHGRARQHRGVSRRAGHECGCGRRAGDLAGDRPCERGRTSAECPGIKPLPWPAPAVSSDPREPDNWPLYVVIAPGAPLTLSQAAGRGASRFLVVSATAPASDKPVSCERPSRPGRRTSRRCLPAACTGRTQGPRTQSGSSLAGPRSR